MTISNQDALVTAGSDITLTFTLTQADGSALDASAETLNWALSLSPGSPALLSKATGGGGITFPNGGGDGIVQVTLDKNDTPTLRGQFYHELQLVDSFSNEGPVSSGLLYFVPGVN